MVVRPWLQYAALYYGGEKLIIEEIIYSYVNLYEDTLSNVLCLKKAAAGTKVSPKYQCQVFLNLNWAR